MKARSAQHAQKRLAKAFCLALSPILLLVFFSACPRMGAYTVDNMEVSRLKVEPRAAYLGEPGLISFRMEPLEDGEVVDTSISVYIREKQNLRERASGEDPFMVKVGGFVLPKMGHATPEPEVQTAAFDMNTFVEIRFVPDKENRVVDARLFYQVPSYMNTGRYEVLLSANDLAEPVVTRKKLRVREPLRSELTFRGVSLPGYTFSLLRDEALSYYRDAQEDFQLNVEIWNTGLAMSDSSDVTVELQVGRKLYPMQVVQSNDEGYNVLADRAVFEPLGQDKKLGLTLTVYMSESAHQAVAGLEPDDVCYLVVNVNATRSVREIDRRNNESRIAVVYMGDSADEAASMSGTAVAVSEAEGMPPRPDQTSITAGHWAKIYDMADPYAATTPVTTKQFGSGNVSLLGLFTWEGVAPKATFDYGDNYLYYQPMGYSPKYEQPPGPPDPNDQSADIPWGIWFGADGDATITWGSVLEGWGWGHDYKVLQTDVYLKMSADQISDMTQEECKQYKFYSEFYVLNEQYFPNDIPFPCGTYAEEFQLFNYAFDVQAGPFMIPIFLGISVQMTAGISGEVGLTGAVELTGSGAGQVAIGASAGPYMRSKANAGVALDATVAQVGITCDLQLMDGSVKGEAKFEVFRQLGVAQLSVNFPYAFEGFRGRLAPYADVILLGRYELEILNWDGWPGSGTFYNNKWIIGNPSGAFKKVVAGGATPEELTGQIVWENGITYSYIDNPGQDKQTTWKGKFNFQSDGSGSPYTFYLENVHDIIVKCGDKTYSNYFMEDQGLPRDADPLTGYWCSTEGVKETHRFVVMENIPAGKCDVELIRRNCACTTYPSAQNQIASEECPVDFSGDFRGYWVKGEIPQDRPVWQAFVYPGTNDKLDAPITMPTADELVIGPMAPNLLPACIKMLDRPVLEGSEGSVCVYPPVVFDKPYTAHFVRYWPSQRADAGGVVHDKGYNFLAVSDREADVAAYLDKVQKPFNSKGEHVVEGTELLYSQEALQLYGTTNADMQVVYAKNTAVDQSSPTLFDFYALPIGGYSTEICLVENGATNSPRCMTAETLPVRLCEMKGIGATECAENPGAYVSEEVRKKFEPYFLVAQDSLDFDMQAFVEELNTFLGAPGAQQYCLGSYDAAGIFEEPAWEPGTGAVDPNAPKYTDYVVGASYMDTLLAVDGKTLLRDQPAELTNTQDPNDSAGTSTPSELWVKTAPDNVVNVGATAYDRYFVNELLGRKEGLKEGKHVVQATFDSLNTCAAISGTPDKKAAQLRTVRLRSFESYPETDDLSKFDLYLFKDGTSMKNSRVYANRFFAEDPNNPRESNTRPQHILPHQVLKDTTGTADKASYELPLFNLDNLCADPNSPHNANCDFAFQRGATEPRHYIGAGIWDGAGLDIFDNEKSSERWFTMGQGGAKLTMAVDRLLYSYKAYEKPAANAPEADGKTVQERIDELYGKNFFVMFDISKKDPPARSRQHARRHSRPGRKRGGQRTGNGLPPACHWGQQLCRPFSRQPIHDPQRVLPFLG